MLVLELSKLEAEDRTEFLRRTMLLMSLFYRKYRSVRYQRPNAEDGACVFTGKAAIYYGKDAYFDDGHIIEKSTFSSVR
jgi:hypothetical protein